MLKIIFLGQLKLGSGSILYVDDISEQARVYLTKNGAKFDTNKMEQLLIELPKNTVILPINTQASPNHGYAASISIYILPDGSALEAVNLTSPGIGKVLLGAL